MTRLLEYDRDCQWLIATEVLRPGEHGAPVVVAQYVPLSVGLALVAVVEQARVVARGWEAYREAQAGRGHGTPHDDGLRPGCSACGGAQYGTEVDLAEYLFPELGRLVDAI